MPMKNRDTLDLLIKKYNLKLKKKIQPEVEVPSLKRQASSNA
jgi:hypothetical protein